MIMKQEDLKNVSSAYYEVADSIARRRLSRQIIKITSLEIDEDGSVLFTESEDEESRLSPIELLIALRDLDPLRHMQPEKTRRNVVTVARVGAMATKGIYNLADRRQVQLTQNARRAVGKTLSVINDNMEGAFRPVSRQLPEDREAIYFLSRAAKLIGHRRIY
jgi:hypothetical protein